MSSTRAAALLLMVTGVLARITVRSAPGISLPPFPPQPAPDYMRDNRGNYWGTAPDKGTLNAPVLQSLNTSTLSELHIGTNTTVTKRQSNTDDYWLSSLGSHGQSPLAPSGYQFFRNIKDFGAVGDGVTDDTAAINRAVATYGLNNLNDLRCGQSCGSSTTLSALVYFPPGTYIVSTPIIMYYFTQFVGNPNNKAVIKGSANFSGIALVDNDVYIPGDNGNEWYINQSNFYRQIRNLVFDLTAMESSTNDGNQGYVPTGLHWQVGQATSITFCDFKMATSNGNGGAPTAVGIFMENGSGGFVSDLTFFGGNVGFMAGSQQFTANNLQFTSCGTAIRHIWNWGFTWKNINVFSCYVAIDCQEYGGATGQGVGSISVIDSVFNSVPYPIPIAAGRDQQPNIVLENLLVENGQPVNGGYLVVYISGGAVLLEGSANSLTIPSWASGYQVFPDGTSGKTYGLLNNPPDKPASLLDSSGNFYSKSKPQYYGSTPIVATDHGIANDGTGDQSASINSFLSSNIGSVLYFPAGIYMVQNTVKIPIGSKIIGSGWSQIMGSGSFFQDASNPQVMVQVADPLNNRGTVEITDMLFTVSGPTAGAILVEWNAHEDTQGSAAMWDSHFRVGGAAGTNLQLSNCPTGATSVNTNCMAATMLFHVTPGSSGYFENVWAWVADHDLDNPGNGQATEGPDGTPQNVDTQISIYAGRGMLIESQGPCWFYGTASEHSQLYQYQLYNASNIYLGHMQTETPYYQPNPNALQPFRQIYTSDPTFDDCSDDSCRTAWALRIIGSSHVFIYAAGFYSFFQNNQLGCVGDETCQRSMIETNYASDTWIFNIFTKGDIEIITPRGGPEVLYFNSTTQNGYTSEIAAWLALSLPNSFGQTNGSSGSVITIDPTLWISPTDSRTVQCFPPCTYVLPPLTLSEPTTLTWPPLTTSATIGYSTTVSFTLSGAATTQTIYAITVTTLTIQIPPVTTSIVSWFDITVTSNATNATVLFPYPSIIPPPISITITDTVGSTTLRTETRTLTPPPWPGTTVPPDLEDTSTDDSSDSSTSSIAPPPISSSVVSVTHSNGPPKPTCLRPTGCGSGCDGLDCFPDPCWIDCGGPGLSFGVDPTYLTDLVPTPTQSDSSESSSCTTTTYTSCTTPAGGVTSCKTVEACSAPTSSTSECTVPSDPAAWTPNDSTPYPSIGAGAPYGTLLVPGTATAYGSMTPAPTYISCSTQNQDPDQGINTPYCVCSGSTFAQSTSGSNSCAYTTVPSTTIAPSVQTTVVTYSSICSVCTFTGGGGGSGTCTSESNCTPSPTPTPSPTGSPSFLVFYVNVYTGDDSYDSWYFFRHPPDCNDFENTQNDGDKDDGDYEWQMTCSTYSGGAGYCYPGEAPDRDQGGIQSIVWCDGDRDQCQEPSQLLDCNLGPEATIVATGDGKSYDLKAQNGTIYGTCYLLQDPQHVSDCATEISFGGYETWECYSDVCTALNDVN